MRKYLWFLIPVLIGTIITIKQIVYVTYSPDISFGSPFGRTYFFAFLNFLFWVFIGAVLQIGKSIVSHEFRLSKITIIIIAVLVIYVVYALLHAYFPNIIPG